MCPRPQCREAVNKSIPPSEESTCWSTTQGSSALGPSPTSHKRVFMLTTAASVHIREGDCRQVEALRRQRLQVLALDCHRPHKQRVGDPFHHIGGAK